jgi:hypothetical protein
MYDPKTKQMVPDAPVPVYSGGGVSVYKLGSQVHIGQTHEFTPEVRCDVDAAVGMAMALLAMLNPQALREKK